MATLEKDKLQEVRDSYAVQIGRYSTSRRSENEIIESLCLLYDGIEKKVDCLGRVTTMLAKLEEEIPDYTRSQKNKEKVAEILCSLSGGVDKTLRMLEGVVITEKKTMEEFRRCEEKIGSYATSTKYGTGSCRGALLKHARY